MTQKVDDYHHLPVWAIWKIYVDFRCTKVQDDFTIAVGSSSGFWFVGWVFYILVLCLSIWMFCFMFFPFLVDHSVILIFLILLESFKAAFGWFFSPLLPHLSSLYLCLEAGRVRILLLSIWVKISVLCRDFWWSLCRLLWVGTKPAISSAVCERVSHRLCALRLVQSKTQPGSSSRLGSASSKTSPLIPLLNFKETSQDCPHWFLFRITRKCIWLSPVGIVHMAYPI